MKRARVPHGLLTPSAEDRRDFPLSEALDYVRDALRRHSGADRFYREEFMPSHINKPTRFSFLTPRGPRSRWLFPDEYNAVALEVYRDIARGYAERRKQTEAR